MKFNEHTRSQLLDLIDDQKTIYTFTCFLRGIHEKHATLGSVQLENKQVAGHVNIPLFVWQKHIGQNAKLNQKLSIEAYVGSYIKQGTKRAKLFIQKIEAL